jgi:glucokinase
MSEKSYAIGVDLGGTKIEVALIDQTGGIIEQARLATDIKGGPKIIEAQILAAIRGLQQVSDGPLVGIGIGVAGQIEQTTGRVHFAPNLNWQNVPLQQDLSRVLAMPIVVANDVRVATWGEWLYGAGKGIQDLICLFVGTGIGGGVVSGGHLLTGYSNTFGELGHVTVDLRGSYCTCGNRGCLESISGGWAIAKRAKEAVQRDPKAGQTLLRLSDGQAHLITAKTVVQAMRLSDPLAEILIEQAIQALIAGCVSFVNAFNPARLILGGGLIEGIPEFIGRIDKGIRQRSLKAASAPLEVLPASLHQYAGVIGAAALVMHTFQHKT